MLVVAGGVTLAVVAVCFWAGHKLARSKGREALPWALVSALLPGIGLLVLAGQRPKGSADEEAANEPGGNEQPLRAVPLQHSHGERWRWLILNDSDIMSAVERLRPYGPPAQVLLRDIYLPAENKAALNSMVAQVVNQARLAMEKVNNPPPAAAMNGGTVPQVDLARYTNRQPAVASAEPMLNGTGVANGVQSVHSRPGAIAPPVPFALPLGASFVNGQEMGMNGFNAETAAQGRLAGPQSGAATTSQARTNDTLASATAALASALRNVPEVPAAVANPSGDATAKPQGETRSKGTAPAAAAPRTVPHHTSVVASDLQGASFLETYRSIHLFALEDGRVYVDKYLAVASVDLAHQAVDYVATRNDT